MSWPQFESPESQAKKSICGDPNLRVSVLTKARLENEAEICAVKGGGLPDGVEHLATGSVEVHGPRPLGVPHGTWRNSRLGIACRQAASIPGILEGNPVLWKPQEGGHLPLICLRDLNCKISNIDFLLFIFKPVPLWVFLPILIDPQTKKL